MGRFSSEQTNAICDLVEQVERVSYLWAHQEHHERLRAKAEEAPAGEADPALAVVELPYWENAVNDLTESFHVVLDMGVSWDTATFILFRTLPYDLAQRFAVKPLPPRNEAA
jgi:hypothetical protein